jgi:hypothetical protein
MPNNRILRKLFVNRRMEMMGFGENCTIWNVRV